MTEVEAYQATTAANNVALAANGASATASSTFGGGYDPSGTINGDRKGLNWGNGGGWNDASLNTYPDWVQVNFNASKHINEIDVFTLQDNFTNPQEPTEAQTFSLYGIRDFQVQYWDGTAWQTVPNGSVTGNNKVWRKFTFPEISTDKIRVYITGTADGYSRITEIEAYRSPITYSYDAAGNLTNDGVHSYQYDAMSRLVKIDNGSTAQYSYDHRNWRVKKAIGSSVTHYVWEGGRVLAEHDGGGTNLVDYIYAGSKMIATVAGGIRQYFISDRLSVRMTVDSSGNVIGRQAHLPFGEDFAESGNQEKHHFTSYERDGESGLDYAVNRHNNSNLGRFNSVDPVTAGISNPQELNRYIYARNDPINRSDRLGLQDEEEDEDTITLSTTESFLPELGGGGGGGFGGGPQPGDFLGGPIPAPEPPPSEPEPVPEPQPQRVPLSKRDQRRYERARNRTLGSLQNISADCQSFLAQAGIGVQDLIDAVNAQQPFNGAASTISRKDAGVIDFADPLW